MSTIVDRIISAVLAVAALVIAVVLVHRELGSGGASIAQAGTAQAPTRVNDWHAVLKAGTRIGKGMARVQIVEFGDFECPFCPKFARSYRALSDRFGPDVSLTFINFPLEGIHRFALPAARAAVCAGQQGRFEDFHDVAYGKQDSLGLKSWVSYASEAGVRDTARFITCNSLVGPVQEVVTGQKLGAELGVRGTPTIMINGWRFAGVPNDSLLASVVAGVLAGKDIAKLVTADRP